MDSEWGELCMQCCMASNGSPNAPDHALEAPCNDRTNAPAPYHTRKDSKPSQQGTHSLMTATGTRTRLNEPQATLLAACRRVWGSFVEEPGVHFSHRQNSWGKTGLNAGNIGLTNIILPSICRFVPDAPTSLSHRFSAIDGDLVFQLPPHTLAATPSSLR